MNNFISSLSHIFVSVEYGHMKVGGFFFIDAMFRQPKTAYAALWGLPLGFACLVVANAARWGFTLRVFGTFRVQVVCVLFCCFAWAARRMRRESANVPEIYSDAFRGAAALVLLLMYWGVPAPSRFISLLYVTAFIAVALTAFWVCWRAGCHHDPRFAAGICGAAVLYAWILSVHQPVAVSFAGLYLHVHTYSPQHNTYSRRTRGQRHDGSRERTVSSGDHPAAVADVRVSALLCKTTQTKIVCGNSCTYQLDSESASISFVDWHDSSLLVVGSLYRTGVLRVEISCWEFEVVSANELVLVALPADQTATYQYAAAPRTYEGVKSITCKKNVGSCRSLGVVLFGFLCVLLLLHGVIRSVRWRRGASAANNGPVHVEDFVLV